MSQEMSSPALEPEKQRRSDLPLVRIVVGLLALVALWLLAREVGDAIPRFAAWIEGLGFWAPVIFIAAYAASVVALVPIWGIVWSVTTTSNLSGFARNASSASTLLVRTEMS